MNRLTNHEWSIVNAALGRRERSGGARGGRRRRQELHHAVDLRLEAVDLGEPNFIPIDPHNIKYHNM